MGIGDILAYPHNIKRPVWGLRHSFKVWDGEGREVESWGWKSMKVLTEIAVRGCVSHWESPSLSIIWLLWLKVTFTAQLLFSVLAKEGLFCFFFEASETQVAPPWCLCACAVCPISPYLIGRDDIFDLTSNLDSNLMFISWLLLVAGNSPSSCAPLAGLPFLEGKKGNENGPAARLLHLMVLE